MPVPTTEELKEEIYALPEQLNQALARKVEAEIEESRLRTEIKKLEIQLKKEEELKEEVGEENDDGNEDAELIEMERELGNLQTELTSTEGRVTLEYREGNKKATDSSARAAVNNNEVVKNLRHKIAEQKSKIKTKRNAQRGRRTFTPARPLFRPRDFKPESPELDSLNEQLTTAENESARAEIEVETIKAKLTTYQMLVQLIAR